MVSKNIITFNFYLLLLLPIALISGPLISDIIVILSFILFFFYIKFYPIELSKKKFFLALLLFWTVSIISSLFSEDIFFSLKSSFLYIRIIIFAIAINIILKINEKNLYQILNILILIFIILFLDSCFQKNLDII